MKFLQIFNKTPNYKKFNYMPRFYNPEEEEMKERISRIEHELNSAKEQPKETLPNADKDLAYRERIRGSFAKARQANGSTPSSTGASPLLLRFTILLVLSVGFIGYLQYGMPALYGIALVLIPIFLFLKYRKLSNRGH
jgi:hypothetical protein